MDKMSMDQINKFQQRGKSQKLRDYPKELRVKLRDSYSNRILGHLAIDMCAIIMNIIDTRFGTQFLVDVVQDTVGNIAKSARLPKLETHAEA
jgi:uncharacterized protein YnzC (UPF0291/DUF896 family)